MQIWIILFLVYLFFYALKIYEFITKKQKFENILDKFKRVSSEFPKFDGSLYDPSNTKRINRIREIIIKNLLEDMPLINDLLPYYVSGFSLSKDAIRTQENFFSLFDSLFSAYNELIYNKKNFLSPVVPLKEMFLIPSKILSWFGVSLDTFKSRFFSLITYILVWIFDKYGREIIDWFLTLIH